MTRTCMVSARVVPRFLYLLFFHVCMCIERVREEKNEKKRELGLGLKFIPATHAPGPDSNKTKNSRNLAVAQ